FISHASPGIDGVLARRVHRDLERAGLAVWRYERANTPCPSVEREVKRRIARCGCFVLLDSPRARQSALVRDECRWIRERVSDRPDSPRIIVCVVDPRSDSRAGGDLFDRQTKARTIELATGNGHYDRGMFDLCRALGTVYLPDFGKPRHE